MHVTGVDHLTSTCGKVFCDYVTVLPIEFVTFLSSVYLANFLVLQHVMSKM